MGLMRHIQEISSPCDDCRHADLCARTHLACEAYAGSLTGAQLYFRRRDWAGKPRKPIYSLAQVENELFFDSKIPPLARREYDKIKSPPR